MNAPYEIWRGIEQSLSGAAEQIYARTRDNAQDCAEGLRFVTRLFDGMREAALEQDAGTPYFVKIMSRTRKYFADCPDADYHRAVVDGNGVYSISGNRGDCAFLSFCIYTLTPQGNRIVSNLSDRNMVFDADGRYEILLEPEHDSPVRAMPAQNRLVLRAGVCTLVVRQYFLDRKSERPASFAIEAFIALPDAPAERDRLDFTKLMRSFNNGFNATLNASDRWVAKPNTISISSAAADVADLFPTPDNYYMGGWYELADDETLELRFVAPQCRYWSVHLMSRWMESIEEARGRQIINKREARIEPSGEVVMTIAPHLRDEVNCLSSSGRNKGFFIFRWMQAPTLPAEPTCRVVRARE